MTPPLGKFDLEWQDDAACRGAGTALWFEPDEIEIALSICSVCPVQRQCRDYADASNEQFGIWGGDTSRLRATSHRARARTATSAERVLAEVQANGSRWVTPHAIAAAIGFEANTVQKRLSRLLAAGAPIERHPKGGYYRVREQKEEGVK